MNLNLITWALVGIVLAALGIATLFGHLLGGQTDSGINPAVVRNFNLRVRAWWLMCSLLAAAVLLGNTITVILFGLISFWALREFITVTPTRLSDHRALFLIFFVFTPLQYLLVGLDNYDLFSVMIPVYAFLFVPAHVAFAGDYKRFLERTAKIQAGLMICVYCLSHAPALINLTENRNHNVQLLFFFVVATQLGDAIQFGFGRLWGKRVIAPAISPNRTWEGLYGSIAVNALLGVALSWATPFNLWQAAGMAGITTLTGFAGGMTMSAIKRDRGVRDYGTLVEGHGGVLDRIDSLCFAAPVFYHLTKSLIAYGWLS
ncbi:MAG: phosphatidate cytidylyltransferase [Planctomycetota bacterium]|nr:MAG: phosphatidate cytidylyltransferase [Planctomycetota bacterium]